MTSWFCPTCRRGKTPTHTDACPNCCGFRSPRVRESQYGSWLDAEGSKGARRG